MNRFFIGYIFFILLFASDICKSQSVVVNGYINFNNFQDEWTELLVTSDDVDMRNWTIRDNNSTQTSWQIPVRFNNIPFWQHLRRGTCIMIWHRTLSSLSVAHTIDANANDGYIEVNLQDATYFNGGDFSSQNTMNIASTGDIIELRDPANVHIHGLGHYQNSSGASWTAMPVPKLNHLNSTNSGDAIYACPGDNLAAFNGPQSVAQTAKNNSTVTFGLPNICVASLSGNRTFWWAMRQPDMTAQTVIPSSIIPGMPGSVTFSWVSATDPYATDNTIGYIILRNTVNTFSSNPADGYTYSIGDPVGGATVVGQINNSTITTFTDNTVMNGNKYYYRVYAFRYTTDNINGNNYDNSRGRAYNETNFVFVDWPVTPLPVELTYFTANALKDRVELKWITMSEINNAYFNIERSSDGINFQVIGKVKGAGSSTVELNYDFDDMHPLSGTSYYRLTQTDYDGTESSGRVVAVHYNTNQKFECNIFPNPASDHLYFNITSPSNQNEIEILIYDEPGKLMKKIIAPINAGLSDFEISLSDFANGIYFISVKSGDNFFNSKVVKN